MRQGSQRWPQKWESKELAYVGQLRNPKTNRVGKHYSCAHCEGVFPSAEVQIDHKEPVVCPIKGFTSWDDFISRMYVDVEGYQVLCVDCHKTKTDEERKLRRINNK